MSTIQDITNVNAELGDMVQSVANGQSISSMRSSVSKNYTKTVDTHMDTSGPMHEKLEHLIKEYAELKSEYYGKYASISHTDNDARVTKFNNQVNNFWAYDDYVRKEKEDYRVASANWNKDAKWYNREWQRTMTQYNTDNEEFKESRRVRHNEALGKIRKRDKTSASTVIEYYVNDYIARRNELFSTDITMSNWFVTNADKTNPYWAKVKRWEKAGYSVTMPAQRVGMTAVANNKRSYDWTMGGVKADTWSGAGSWWNNAPWNGSYGGDNSITDGSVIWYGHGPSQWSKDSRWPRWANTLGIGPNVRRQENWGNQPLDVPYVFYTTFFVDPQGPTTGHMYGWCDSACRVYVNNVDVYDKVIRGGWKNKGKWNWSEGTKQNKPNNKSDPIKLNKGFNMIAVVAVNKGGPAGMSWTMWNDPKYWDGIEVDVKPTWFGKYDTEKTGVLVRTDATWRCVLQNVKAPKLKTYHEQATKEPYSDANLSLPGFIKNDSTLVQEFNPSSMKKFKAAKGVRYVRVVAEGNLCMQISQLAVYPMDNQGKNIAQGKPTTAKDMHANTSPDNAVDGQLKSKPFPHIYHSACKKDPWWQVDLGAVHNIAKIVYYNRGDCCRSRAKTLKLQFMDADKKILWTGDEFGSSAAEQTFAFGDVDLTVEAAPTIPNWESWNTPVDTENITVGSSGSNVKTVSLPRENMYISGVPMNPQKVTWSDSFTASVSGKTLTVRRTDTRGGWTQDLVLRTISNPQDKPVPPVIMPQVWPGLDAYQTPQLALLEKISAKSHEIIKMSEKVHLHYAAVAKNKDLTMFGTQRDNAYKGLTSRYMSMLEERSIVEDAITEFESVRAEQLSSDLSVDTSRIIYLVWGVTAAVLVVLIMLYAMKPNMGGVVKGEISSIFVIVACIAILASFFGNSHLILPACIMVVFFVLYYLHWRSKSGGGPGTPIVTAPAVV